MASVQSHFWWLVRKSGFRHKVSLRPRARGSRGPWGQAWSSCFHTRGVAACARPTGRTRHRRISATFATPVPRWSPAATLPSRAPVPGQAARAAGRAPRPGILSRGPLVLLAQGQGPRVAPPSPSSPLS